MGHGGWDTSSKHLAAEIRHVGTGVEALTICLPVPTILQYLCVGNGESTGKAGERPQHGYN